MSQQPTVALPEEQFRVVWELALRAPKSQGEALAMNVIGGEAERQLIEQKRQAIALDPTPPAEA
jgi:hypothetical protein